MWIILALFALVLCIWAQWNVKHTYKKYSQVQNARGLTGAQVARTILNMNGLTNISVEHVSGDLTDHYDPVRQVVSLSDAVYGETSVAALGVAAHECGHAVQHAQNYQPMILRSKVFPVASLGSNLWYLVFVAGIIVDIFSSKLGSGLMWLAVILFAAVTIFQFVTLPVEFDASKRAMNILETEGFLGSNEEVTGARKVLQAAAMTYVASLINSIIQLLRLISSARRN
ncbi:MAG: zinc metallopeptidase [Oscillospiraceae bacterium]